jgi:hypothetical protein
VNNNARTVWVVLLLSVAVCVFALCYFNDAMAKRPVVIEYVTKTDTLVFFVDTCISGEPFDVVGGE